MIVLGAVCCLTGLVLAVTVGVNPGIGVAAVGFLLLMVRLLTGKRSPR